MIKLAAFFGNPGTKYAQNRHNAGRMLATALPFYQTLSWQKKYKGIYSVYDNIHFIMPETYMNLSGESVFAVASFYKIQMEEIIVVHDELELPLGAVSLKFAGGLGGHNGLRSMKNCFGNADCWRIRIGIGRPGSRLPGEGGPPVNANPEITDWVLSNFTKPEEELLIPTLELGTNLLMQTFSCDPQTLLKEWAKKKIAIPEKPENANNSEAQEANQ